jgi:hypothetical protein
MTPDAVRHTYAHAETLAAADCARHAIRSPRVRDARAHHFAIAIARLII